MKNRPSGFGIEELPRIVRGRGSYLFDAAGRRYLDGSGGPAVFCLGHAHPEVNAAITAQLHEIAYAYRYLFTSSALEGLTETVLRLSGGHFQDIVFTGSGSEAVESALKIALQHFAARGLMNKRRFIARRRSWHGNTLGALSISDFAQRRRAFEGSLLDVTFVSAANAYRLPDGVGADGLVAHLAAELEHAIESAGPQCVAAFVFEPIVGAAGGVVPAPPGYAQAIQAVCRKYDVLLIADEVMCGAGRTGCWRALEHERVVPDIMSIAKGLAGGYIPLGATLVTAARRRPHLKRTRRVHDRTHLHRSHRRLRGRTRRAAHRRARSPARPRPHRRGGAASEHSPRPVEIRRGRRRPRAGILRRHRAGSRSFDQGAVSFPTRAQF